MTLDKVFEKLIAKIIIKDMKPKIDPSQYGNQYVLSIQHYLIKMIHKILSDIDNSETTAVLATFITWKYAFPNQYPKLGLEAFIKGGVRSSLIPVLADYFIGRSIIVKWHRVQSRQKGQWWRTPRRIFWNFGIFK